MSDLSARRPIKTRDTSFAKMCARGLLKTGLTPNMVSVLSVVFALMCAGCIHLTEVQSDYWWIGAAACIQLRLLCNLLDGMMAVEGGKGTPNGDIYNELPDRLSDVIIIATAGYYTACPFGVTLGWIASSGALLTAYARAHGASLTGKHDFGGPFAKAHRMALLTVCFLIMPFSSHLGFDLLFYTLGVVAAGSFLTALLRYRRLSQTLMKGA